MAKRTIFNLSNFSAQYLEKNPEKKFTSREIAEWIFKTYPEACEEKRQKSIIANISDDKVFVQQLVAEISAHRINIQNKNANIRVTEERPRKFYYSELDEEQEIEGTEQETKENENDWQTTKLEPDIQNDSSHTTEKPKESDLYPVLNEYLESEGILSIRINENKSSNKRGAKGNQWLYPDLVGKENLSAEWVREIKDCVQQYADKKTRLWSFEVKIIINNSNLRESFFQAVSNSSWANLGFLVATQFSGKGIMKEMRMLSNLHGIGFIKLDVSDPSESQILVPARERHDIDWATANRIARENTDFLKYIKLVRQFYQTGEINKAA